jgi:hypothetical protein
MPRPHVLADQALVAGVFVIGRVVGRHIGATDEESRFHVVFS